MNDVLMPLLQTLDKYLFCTETYKFGNHEISYVLHNAGYDKMLTQNKKDLSPFLLIQENCILVL